MINFVQSYNFYTYINVGIYRKFLSSPTFLIYTTVSTALSPPFNHSLYATPSCAIALPQSQKLKKRGQKKPVSLSFLKNL